MRLWPKRCWLRTTILLLPKMTYVFDITLALVHVLERAALLRDRRLAGYAANASFWAGEVRHALDVIEGYETRTITFRKALQEDMVEPSAGTSAASDLAKLTRRLKAAATRFFRVCRRYLDRAQVLEIEQLLGIHIEQRVRD
jgi:hypothetical protein